MSKATPRVRRARGSIDPEFILDGAFALAEREGLDNLSMPGLAAHLDVGVTSIYWYYRNKEELLRRMSSRAIEGLHDRLIQPDGWPVEDWRLFLVEYARAQRQAHSESALLTEITMMRTASYSRRATQFSFSRIEAVLEYLMKAGFSLPTAWYVYSAFSVYVRGYVLAEYNREANHTPPVGLAQLSLLDVEATPLLTKLISEEPVIMDMTGESAFEFSLELLGDAAMRLLHADTAVVPAT